MRKTFPLTLNSILFITGIGFLLIQRPIWCAVCFLLASLLFIWTFKAEQTAGPPPDEMPSVDTDALNASLTLRIKELTDSNQLLSRENQQLTDELNLYRNRHPNPLYTCPLTSALPVCLDTFFTGYLNSRADLAESGRLHVDYTCSAPDAVTYLSPSALTLICSNVFDNLLKFSPRAESVYIRLTVIENDSLIIFKNEGDGPEESELDRLFDLNYQGTNKKSGCGLGLAQVKALTDDFGGHVWAKSANGSGFALYIRLPEQPSASY